MTAGAITTELVHEETVGGYALTVSRSRREAGSGYTGEPWYTLSAEPTDWNRADSRSSGVVVSNVKNDAAAIKAGRALVDRLRRDEELRPQLRRIVRTIRSDAELEAGFERTLLDAGDVVAAYSRGRMRVGILEKRGPKNGTIAYVTPSMPSNVNRKVLPLGKIYRARVQADLSAARGPRVSS